MRVLKWIIGILFLLAIAFVVGGMLLPREVSVARSIEINAPPEARSSASTLYFVSSIASASIRIGTVGCLTTNSM